MQSKRNFLFLLGVSESLAYAFGLTPHPSLLPKEKEQLLPLLEERVGVRCTLELV